MPHEDKVLREVYDGQKEGVMTSHERSAEDVVRCGQALYDQSIRERVEEQNRGKFLALDVDTGEYEIDSDELAALDRASAKRPHSSLYLIRVGYPTAHRIGVLRRADAS